MREYDYLNQKTRGRTYLKKEGEVEKVIKEKKKEDISNRRNR